MKPPTVISILALDNLALTRDCLESIFENTVVPHTVCVVNQASTDGTREYLDALGEKIDVVHLDKNVGFVGGNNLVMDRYPDRDIVLLNNDTIVSRGWLRALEERAYSDSAVGIVGAKLLYPGGRLQEAGGEIFRDGSGRNIGKNDDPDRYIYSVCRDVDYCSGACLFVKRAVLDKIGYLDEMFSPAYWEDTDLCFRARKAGWRVVYEPEARVVHLEGATAGAPGQASLSRSLQDKNKPKFMARWREELKSHRKNVFEVRPGDGREQILVLLPFLPMYDRAAGEKRWFHTLKILSRHFDVTFLARNGAGQLKYINELEKMGITVFHTDQSRLEPMGCSERGPTPIDFPLLLESNEFKAVIVGFYHVAHQYYRDIRKYSPESLLIVDSYDLCWVRERRKADLSNEASQVWKALEVKRRELGMYRKADMVLTVTEEDRRRLREEAPGLPVGISTDIHPLIGEGRPGRGRDLVFVGNYKHDPNEDAVLYFVREVLPFIRERIPGVRLFVVGNSPTERLQALASDEIVVTGFVPEVTPYLLDSRVFIVPLRYGAGLKGKIGEALAAGIPIVTTSVGAEGMNLVHGANALIGDAPEDFARSVAEVYEDEALWDRLSAEGMRHAARNYSVETVEKHWLEIIDFIRGGRKQSEPPPAYDGEGFKRTTPPPEIVPEVAVVIPVYNNLDLTRTCWTSLTKNTPAPHQVVMVDNGSTEDVAYEADQNNFEVIRNETNRGFAHACNQGIMHTHGDFVVILNNDTIVTPGWLERLMWHMKDDPGIGVLGVTTNYAGSEQEIAVSYKTERELYDLSEGLYRRFRHQRKTADKVVAVCAVLRRRMLEDIGLFDTRFGLGNFEDDDLCLRARVAGYEVAFARDVFIHHAGSKTFQALRVDYGGLMEENRGKYRDKWATVARAFCTCHAAAENGASHTGALSEGAIGHAVAEGGASHTETLSEGAGAVVDLAKIRVSEELGLADAVLAKVGATAADTVFLLMPGTVTPAGWTAPLEAAFADDSVGCALAASNMGFARDRVEPGYRKPGKPFVRFARKQARLHKGEYERIDIGYPAALAVKKRVLERCGLGREFATPAILLDLERRLLDAGLGVLCVKGAYVHAANIDEACFKGEKQAVLEVLAARKSLDAGDAQGALQHLDLALEAKGDYVEALYSRALVFSLTGAKEKAVAEFERLLAMEPSNSKAANNLGCLFFDMGDQPGAEHRFREAVRIDPANWEAKKNLADLLLYGGNGAEATDIYTSLIEEHGGRPGVYTSVADVFANLGDLQSAEHLYRMALRIFPQDPAAKRGLETVRAAMAGVNTPGQELAG
jgi:GT2 family glycosyltransferase/tetratricopeptide (TPR) repeat protein